VLLGGARTSETAKQNEHAISQTRLELRAADTSDEIRRVNDRLFLLEQQRWITPEVSILKARARAPVPLSTVRRVLSNRTAILEYVLSDPNSYCLVITRDRARIVRLTSRNRIETLVTTYLSAIKARKPDSGTARELYDELIAPLGDAGWLSNLLIVRDGELHLLPFEALIDTNGAYVNDRCIVSYLPSVASFYLLSQKAGQAPKTSRDLLALGGVAYTTDRGRSKNLIAVRGSEKMALTDLPTSNEEIQIAAATFPHGQNDVLTGTAATKFAFKNKPLADFRVLHLAVHGLVDQERMDRAALVLLDDPKAGEDGLLQAPEIAQLQLHADLVVLSACDTGNGKVQGQEGIETLAHSFVLAGAKSIISTLWSIDDRFSLALIQQFYLHYRMIGSPADALALAKRDMLSQYGYDTNPFYWAAFTFEGVPKAAVSNYDTHANAN
jgi:CHAT domain-containing protein